MNRGIFVRVIVALINGYQFISSRFLPPHCRFYPTCSQYAKESVMKHGLLKGLFFSIIRIGKCHPFHPGGLDPVR